MTRARFRLILALGGLCGAFVAMSGARAASWSRSVECGADGISAAPGLSQASAQGGVGGSVGWGVAASDRRDGRVIGGVIRVLSP